MQWSQNLGLPIFTSGIAGVSRGGMNQQSPVARAGAAAAARKVKSSKLRPKSENQYIKLINWEY